MNQQEAQHPAADANGTPQATDLKFTLEEVPQSAISIKVIGIGGCGGNIVDHMIESGVGCVEFATVNTDQQALRRNRAETKVKLGERVTQGHGTGSNPDIGREAALENTEELTELLGDADMVFLAVGMGGGTGTGAAPVIASLAKQVGALTIAVAVKPFSFEGSKRSANADRGVAELLEQVDTAVIIPNERVIDSVEQGSGFFDGFLLGNEIARETLVGITDVITKTGVMNCDFADLRTVFQEAGRAVVTTARASGRNAAVEAARGIISSQSMEHSGLSNATKVLVNVTGSGQFGLHDASEALRTIQQEIGPQADLTVGVVRDDSLGEDVRVLMIASGFAGEGFGLEPGHGGVAAREQSNEQDSPWRSQRVVEVMDADNDGRDRADEPAAEGEFPAMSESASEPQAPEGEAPFDYMPPPNIRVEEEAEEEPTPQRSSFFRRKTLFR